MKVLITGSSGLLGRILSSHLVSQGIKVVGLDIKASKEPLSSDYFHFYNCCITDRDRLESIFDVEHPTHVVHFACTFNKVRDPEKEYKIDIGGSRNVLEVVNRTPSVRQLVYSSSAAAYGGHPGCDRWLTESDPLKPGGYRYGINKKLIEEAFFGMPARENLHIVTLRICQVVGPAFDKPKSAVSILIKLPWLPRFSRKNKLQFLHSDDFTALVERVLFDKEIEGIFNLAPDSYEVVEELVGKKTYLHVPLELLTGTARVLWNLKILNIQPESLTLTIFPTLLDPARIQERYGYHFRYSTKEAFEDTVARNKIPKEALF